MTDTAEIIARAIYRKDWSISVLDDGADDPQDPMRWDSVTKDEHDKYIWWAEAAIAALTEAGMTIVPVERLHDLKINLLGAMEDYGDEESRLTIARVAGQLRSLERSGDCAKTLHLAKEASQ